MIAFGNQVTRDRTRREMAVPDADFSIHKAEWMESGDDPVLSPTIFLIEQPPRSTVVAHFHKNNQFQLFVDGSGEIGRYALGPVVVHYAGAFTPYGPLVAGPEGLKYFTIRAVREQGGYLPTDLENRQRGPRRHEQTDPILVPEAGDLLALDTAVERILIPADTGLEARTISLPPQGLFEGRHTPESEGQFVVVLAGTVEAADRKLGLWESLYVPASDPFPAIVAGPDGAHLVALSPPRRDPAYV